MKKYFAASFFLLLIFAAAQAHEFWLQADKFFVAVGERVKIKFMVGENFMGEPWDLKVHQVEKLELHEGTSVKDLRDSLNVDEQLLKLTFKEEGTKLIVMQSNSAFIELDAAKFNEYLKEDGLDDVLAFREKNKLMNKPSREFYSRHTKLFLQAGEKRDDVFRKTIGLPVEIISDKNPCALKKGDRVRFTILFNGKPFFGAKVRIWNRFDNRTTIQNIFTEKDGTIQMNISNPGHWMISVVRMVPSKDPKADWQSYWGSFVFATK